MAVDFTYDVSTDVGKMRLYLGDHKRASFAFSDTELNTLKSIGGTWELGVAEAALVALGNVALRARLFRKSETAGDNTTEIEIDDTQRVAALEGLIARFGQGANRLPKARISYRSRHPSDPLPY